MIWRDECSNVYRMERKNENKQSAHANEKTVVCSESNLREPKRREMNDAYEKDSDQQPG